MERTIALGMIETRGFAGLTQATDTMMKAANVELVRQFYIGGSFAITIVKGDVGAVKSSVAAARCNLGELCNVVAAHIIPMIEEEIVTRLLRKDPPHVDVPRGSAVGVVETVGVAGALEAAKRGLDAADVTLSSFESPGGGLMATCYWGEVASVRAAVEAAAECCVDVTKVHNRCVIPAPHSDLAGSFAPQKKAEASGGIALATLETIGFVSLFEAADEALKTAKVDIGNWKVIGSGYNSISMRGEVADIRSALEAAEQVARRKDRFVDSILIPMPHSAAARLAGAKK